MRHSVQLAHQSQAGFLLVQHSLSRVKARQISLEASYAL